MQINISEDLEALRHYNNWRRGADVPQPNPKELGKVIDRILYYTSDWGSGETLTDFASWVKMHGQYMTPQECVQEYFKDR